MKNILKTLIYACIAISRLASAATSFGNGGETGIAVATDPLGNVIITGTTTSSSLPGTANAFQQHLAAGLPNHANVFVAKFDPTGTILLWATFLGGNGNDSPIGIQADLAGNIYVLGSTQSSTVPSTGYVLTASTCETFYVAPFFCNYYSTPPAQFSPIGFLTKISPDGHSVLYSLVTGGWHMQSFGITPSGVAWIGAGPALFEVNAQGTGFTLGTLLGGCTECGSTEGDGAVNAIAFDSDGNVYAGGSTFTDAYTQTEALGESAPSATSSAYQNQFSKSSLNSLSQPAQGVASANGYLFEFDPKGITVLYGTYFGPEYYGTTIDALVVNPNGTVTFGGYANATSFQATTSCIQAQPSATGCNSTGYVATLTLGANDLLPENSTDHN
jgi:hypothetical protein